MWEKVTVEPGAVYRRQVGALTLWVRQEGDEWQVAWEYGDDDSVEFVEDTDEALPEGVEWHRWVVKGTATAFRLEPAMPDRPVVVRPESELRIGVGAEALFFVLLPIWVRVVVVAGKVEHLLVELPTMVLSNTWFGQPHDGELCYSLRTSARRSLAGVPPRPNRAASPVYVENAAPTELTFTRLSIHVGYLNVYGGDNFMWTNALHVRFRGVEQVSQIRYETKPPGFEGTKGLVGKARENAPRGLMRKSFDTFRLFSGG
jgi:hypothetical protein